MTKKDKTILAGCLKGDRDSWDDFVLRYSSLVYHTIKRTFSLYHADPRADLVDDLYQEFFLAIVRDDFKKLRQFRGDKGCTLASWLRLVASRLTIDSLRKQGTHHHKISDTLPADQPDPLNAIADREYEALLSTALGNLSSRDRIFVTLYFERELQPEEIAKILSVSVSAVYTQKSRVLEKLRDSLKKTQFL